MILGGLAGIARERQGKAAARLQLGPQRRQFRLPHHLAGQTATLCDIEGAGVVRHIWCTIAAPGSAHYPRTTVLRMWWDDAASPCVEAPIGDFFGIGHGIVRHFWSLPLSMSPQDGLGFNCFFPMPFGQRARIEVANEGQTAMMFYYYVDYEEHDRLEPDLLRFHAQWRRENPTQGWGEGRFDDEPEQGQLGDETTEGLGDAQPGR